ncbi:MAG: tRNA 2-thiouridine(34) synthase MnmA [Bacteroidales bacterium]|nr:tRNA 2-thiouridine(34) synthase MnmA [Bacteroidales bacterium]
MNRELDKVNSIAVLISGGVDSAVVVHQLCEQGYKPDLHYIKIGMEGEDSSCTAEEDIELSQATARKYGLTLEVTDLQKEYWDLVVGYAIDRIKQGLTPNPDVMCNRFIKFGAFEQRIGHQYDKIATGHYATTIQDEQGLIWLGTAKDPVKDQTDFLAQLNYEQLSHTIFPIGHMLKEDVRRIALDAHLPSAYRKDSQGICFLGKINYNDFIRKFMGEQEGRIIDIETGKVVGRHKGFWFHTIGQRKGLGLSGGPWFVVKKNVKKNIVFVANGWDTQLQYGHDFLLADLHFITKNPWAEAPKDEPIQFKIRHVDHFMRGTITHTEEGYIVHSDDPIQGIAPGQFGCIYDAEARVCYGSGEIGYYRASH